MKDKIISWILGAVLCGLVVFLYWYINNWANWTMWNWVPPSNFWSWAFDSSNMSDEQLEKMAERAGITKEELKSKLDSWEDIRSLMWGQRWSWRWNSATGNTQ